MSYRRREPEERRHLNSSSESKRNDSLKPKATKISTRGVSLQWNTLRRMVAWRYLVSWLCFWVCLVQYYENTVVKRAMRKCQWSSWETWPQSAIPHHMAVLADPQIMDAHSYPGRPWIVNYFTQKIVDNYHARNWKHMHYTLDPDSTFFLGDLFDGGRRWEDSDWIAEYARFNNIFPKKPNRLTVMSLPGNHDIGFGDTVVEESLSRFKVYFGETSTKWDVGNHTIVLLDTISLSDTQSEKVSAVPRNFLDSFAKSPKSKPRILLTHVPLWRDPNVQTCGRERESPKPFPVQKGVQYQTLIENDLSQEVLQKIGPSLVLSGDDHDYCHVKHTYSSKGESETAEEITVKSCAMNMGISRPAIQLLSLHNPQQSPYADDTFQTSICYLPDPFKSLQMYICAYVLTLLFIGWMSITPKSFQKVLGRSIGKNTKDVMSVLPLASKKSSAPINDLIDMTTLTAAGKAKQFLINGLVMSLMVSLVFIFQYTKT
ncbi:LAFA_0G08306g1_1 [Lachancea sp. 'fantastica']|nr:LAFA_0G08306g1_1 [Lachancea sp. 'fantastica']